MQVYPVPVTRFAGPRGTYVSLFGATPQSNAAVPADVSGTPLGDTIQQFAAAESTLTQARAQVVAAYNAAVQARVPLDGVGLRELADQFNRQRSALALQLAKFVEMTVDTIEAGETLVTAPAWLPGADTINKYMKSDIRQKVGDATVWGQALLDRVPPIRPVDLQGVNFGFVPAALGAPVVYGLFAVIGLGVVGYFTWQTVRAFNDQATASTAEAERIRSLAASKIDLIQSMKAAGLSPAQIADELARQAALNKPPDPGTGITTWLLVGLAGAGLAAAAWYGLNKRRQK